MSDFSFSQHDGIVEVHGVLDADNATKLCGAFTDKARHIFDFGGVPSVNFASLLVLYAHRSAGHPFIIVNASADVALFIESTGVGMQIPVCAKPRAIDIADYVRFGESFVTEAYKSLDGDAMIKVARHPNLELDFYREKVTARTVLQFGIPTPFVGDLVMYDNRIGLEFQMVKNKVSFARGISNQPEMLSDYAIRFARMARKLHETPCDVTAFPSTAEVFKAEVANSKVLSDEQKWHAVAYIDTLPSATTCLHGDMHIGNVITNGVSDLWIDLADFGYGNPIIDLGRLYFVATQNPDALTQDLYHITNAQFGEVWRIFIREYYDGASEQQIASVQADVENAAVLTAIQFAGHYGINPVLQNYIDKYL